MRIPVLLLLLAAACTSKPVMHGDGSTPGPTGDPKPPTQCYEVSRSRCATAQCKGNDMDYVVLQCASGRVARCEASKSDCP